MQMYSSFANNSRGDERIGRRKKEKGTGTIRLPVDDTGYFNRARDLEDDPLKGRAETRRREEKEKEK